MEDAYLEEEAFWRQRSRIQWLNWGGGDKNSSFFHAVTRNRRACNKFSIIENEAGQALFDEHQIANAFVIFYQQLFTAGSTDSTSVVQEALTPKVTEAMNQMLISLPEKQEVKEAVFSINPDKALGPDGLSASFYQVFWDIIGDVIYRDIHSFFETSYLHPHHNETHVRLILKTTSAKTISDYRPISLCNTHARSLQKSCQRGSSHCSMISSPRPNQLSGTSHLR